MLKLAKLLLITCVISFLSVSEQTSSAQEKTATLSLATAKSSDGISEAKILELDAYVAKVLNEWQVPGLSIAVVKDDQVVLCKGYGFRRVGGNEPVDQNTLFAIASNSKAFTASSIAILVDEGKLSWDDKVTKYLPWFRLKNEHASSDMRVRDLLCHRSGLGTFSGDLLWWGTSYSPKEILIRAAELEPSAPFRAEFGYSNLMYLAAGEVIVAASGQTWPEFVQSRILGPLEMNRSITSVRDLVSKDNYATPHKTLLDRSEPIAWMNWDAMAAAGGIISSADDMSRWLKLQLRHGQLEGDRRLFSANAAHEMWQAHTPIKQPIEPSKRFSTTHFGAYGLGWSLSDYHGRKLVGHSGGYDGMNSRVVLVPEEKLGVVVLTNSLTSISNLVAYAAIDKIMGIESQDWSRESLEKFQQSRKEFTAATANL